MTDVDASALVEADETGQGGGVRRSSALIMVVVGLQVAANAAFWVAASRSVDSSALGDAGELFTSLQFIVYLTGLGLTITNSRFGADGSPDADGLLSWSLLTTSIGSVLGAAAYLVVLGALADGDVVTEATTIDLLGGPGGMALLGALAVGTSLGLLVDVRLMAARLYGVLMVRAVIIGALRLPLLFVDAPIDEASWVFVLSAGPTLLYGLSGVALLPRVCGVRYHLRPLPSRARMLRHFALVNYGATLSLEAPQFALPVIVGLWVHGSDYASFFVAWGAAAALLLLPAAIAQVSLVEAARATQDAPRRATDAMAIAVGIAVLALIGAIVANDLVVVVYGEDYEEAARLLPAFVAAGIPWAVSSIALAEARVRRDHTTIVGITATLGIGILLPALVLVPDHGVDGAMWAWLGGNVAAAGVGGVLTIRRRRRRSAQVAGG